MQDFPQELMHLKPELRVDGWWAVSPELDGRAAARIMLAGGARLVTMTACARADGETDVIYHYAAPSAAYNLKTTTRSNSLPSIAIVLPAADWIEREIHDLFAVQFEGHPNLVRLVRPPEIAEGFFRQPGGAASRQRKA